MERDKTSLTVTKTSAPKEATLRSLPHVHGKNLVAEELLRGFGIRFSFTAHDLHGLKFGPAGRRGSGEGAHGKGGGEGGDQRKAERSGFHSIGRFLRGRFTRPGITTRQSWGWFQQSLPKHRG
jgi:hypothetical protein